FKNKEQASLALVSKYKYYILLSEEQYMSSTDKTLGLKVQQYLSDKGVETPTIETNLNSEEKRTHIEGLFAQIMLTLGLNLNDDSLHETPRRVAKMYVNEIFRGLDYDNFPKCTAVDNKMKYNEMVVVKDITAIS